MEDIKNNTEELLIDSEIIYIEYDLPDKSFDSSFKAYMDYRTISDKTSAQWEIQQSAWTDEQGFRRVENNYCVAIGTYYSQECGSRFKITLDADVEFTVIVADIKNPIHTDDMNMYVPISNTQINIVEFVVDTDVMDESILQLGSVSELGFKGNIKKIQKIERIN